MHSLEQGTPYEFLEPRYKGYQNDLENIKSLLYIESQIQKVSKEDIIAFIHSIKNDSDTTQRFINLLKKGNRL